MIPRTLMARFPSASVSERVAFGMGFRPRRIRPGYTLCHEPSGACGIGGSYEIPCSLVADTGVAYDGFSHAARIEAARQISQLMDHDIGLGRRHLACQGRCVEDVHHDRIDPAGAQRVCSLHRPGCSRHVMTRRSQERGQSPADDTGRAGQKDTATHPSSLPCRGKSVRPLARPRGSRRRTRRIETYGRPA